MRGLRWRAALGLAGVAVVFAWVWASGGTKHLLTIDYTWVGAYLNGAEVYANGEVIGTLEPYAPSQFSTGFEMEPGTYRVKVVHPACPNGREYEVVLGGSAGRRRLMIADLEDEGPCRVVLR